MARVRIELATLALLAPRSADRANRPSGENVAGVGSTLKFYVKQLPCRRGADSNLVSRVR